MQKFNAPEELVNEVREMMRAGESRSVINQHIEDTTGFRKTKRNELYNEIVAEINYRMGNPEEVDETDVETLLAVSPGSSTKAVVEQKLEFGERYTYNKDSDQYVVFLKSAARNVVVPGATHRAMLKAYSNWTGEARSIDELCNAFEMPREYFEEYKSIMGWTHGHEPVTKEQLESTPTDKLVEDILSSKRFELNQKFQKEDWKETQKDAELWREFCNKRVDPFVEALANWVPPEYKGIPDCEFKATNSGKIFVVGAFDLHIGALAEGRYLFRGKTWNIETAKEAIMSYLSQIRREVENRIDGFDKAVLLMGGDIMHGIRGMTEKGTPLLCDKTRDTQVDAALDILTFFISGLAELFPSIEVHGVRGNHDGTEVYLLMKAIEAYFHTEDRIGFNIHSSRTAVFRIGPVLTLLDHGASDTYKGKIPKAPKARESYIQSLLLAHPDLLAGVKQKIFVCGDMHHTEQKEYNDFEYYMFGAMPLGDKYASDLNLDARPRQNCLVVDESGVRENISFYFD